MGVVERVLKRARERLVGTLDFRKGRALLLPDEPNLPELPLAPEGLEGLKRGSRIVVQVHYGKRPYGTFLAYLGEGRPPRRRRRPSSPSTASAPSSPRRS